MANFEAGALSKSFDKSRVSPFLFALKRSDVKAGPILQFQSTIAEKEDVRKLLKSINGANQSGGLAEDLLNKVFENSWPSLEEGIRELEEQSHTVTELASPAEKTSNGKEILEELLDLVRQQHRILNDPGTLLPSSYLNAAINRSDDDKFKSVTSVIFNKVLDDLAERWTVLKELVENKSKEFDFKLEVDFKEVVRAINDLGSPVGIIISRYSGIRAGGYLYRVRRR